MRYMWWCFIVVLVSGSLLAVCAFIPGMAPVLIKMGAYPAGDIGDGIQRYVELPGYGLFVFEVSLCPALFRLKRWQSVLLFVLGFGMIMLGGNRSALAGAIIVAPVMLFLRGKTHTVVVSIFLMAAAIGAMKFTVDSMDTEQIPKLLRCFGIFDSKIEKASGGDVSANARYGLWKDAMTKIMESPLAGKGFGNLPQHVQGSDAQRSNDFEVVLAGGESHNGFINAAYAFGIPFALALSVAMILYFFKEALLALRTDPHDLEMRELHVFIAGMFASYPILIYTAFDLSDGELWIYAAISTIVSRLPRQDNRPVADAGVALRKYGEEPRPAGQYDYR
jgi:O-antigen ligase